MGYHDLEPEAFIFSVAVQETNTAEDAALFDKWLRECKEKAKKLASKDNESFQNNDMEILP